MINIKYVVTCYVGNEWYDITEPVCLNEAVSILAEHYNKSKPVWGYRIKTAVDDSRTVAIVEPSLINENELIYHWYMPHYGKDNAADERI